jgi:predicted permease
VWGGAPGGRAAGARLASVLREGNGGSAGRSRLQGVLVATQVALSMVALVCAGLFVRGFERAQRIDTGMRAPERVLLAQADLYAAGYTDSSTGAVLDRLAERLRALPGVSAVSWSDMVPLGIYGWQTAGFAVEGYVFGPDERRDIPHSLVGPEYFEAVGSPIVRGRGFASRDLVAGGWNAAVVNEAFVRRFWPGQDPLGKRVDDAPNLTVVGVVRDARYQTLDETAVPVVFIAASPGVVTLHVRTRGDAAALQESLRRAFDEVDPNLAPTNIRTLARSIEAATFSQRMGAWSLSAIGLLALLLAAVGLFGVLSYSVAQRTREMGVRIAVGASTADVVGLVVGRALRLTAIGLGVGLVLAAGAGQLLRSQIFDVSPLDPVTFVAVIALLAAWLPARRAARVDPIIALQAE